MTHEEITAGHRIESSPTVMIMYQQTAMKSPLPHVFVIGSSTTLLFGPHLKRMLTGVYRYSRKGDDPASPDQALGNLDCPQGASAGDSAMVLEFLATLDGQPAFRPDVVLLHVGAHDIKRPATGGEPRVSLQDYHGNITGIVDWFERKRIALVWLRSGPLDETLHNARSKGFKRFEADLDAYNAVADHVMSKHNVSTLDLAGFTRRLGPMDQLLKDHIHFQDEVVQAQAAFIAGYLMGLIAPGRAAAD